MGEEGYEAGADRVDRVIELTRRQDDLWQRLRDEQDEDKRIALFDELTANRADLAKLREQLEQDAAQPVARQAEPPRHEPPAADPVPTAPIAAEPVPAEPVPAEPMPAPGQVFEPITRASRVSRVAEPPPVAEPPQAPQPTPASTSHNVAPAEPAGAPPGDAEIEVAVVSSPSIGEQLRASLFSSEAGTRQSHRARPRPEPSAPAPTRHGSAPIVPNPPTVDPGEVTPQPPSRSRVAYAERPDDGHAHQAYLELERVRPHLRRSFPILAALVAIAAVVAVAWFLFLRDSGKAAAEAGDVTTTTLAAAETPVTAQIRAVLDGLGYSTISVEDRSGTIFLIGPVGSEQDRNAVIGASKALAGATEVDTAGVTVAVGEDELRSSALGALAAAGYEKVNVSISGGVATVTGVTPESGVDGLIATLEAIVGVDRVVDMTEATDRTAAFQTELNRVTASTPIVFASGQTELNVLQERILDSIAEIIVAYPGPQVTVVGYTDAAGAADENERLSRIRAEAVRDYLVSQGIAADRFIVEGRGETTATGSDAVANLERRVEFEVGYSVLAPAGDGTALRIAIVAPSARDDYAFTESIVDAVGVIAGERGNVEVAISDGLFVPEEAEAAIRQYAEQGYDLVIAHGSQYGTSLVDIAPDYPETAFAWGTAADTFGLANVSAYEVASDQGGYVEGSIAALISDSGTIGVVGPLEVGDAKLYVDGFRNGVLAEHPEATVPVVYTGSFSDLTLAAEAAQQHIAAGADVLTGSAQMVVGALGVATENDAAWFGTQANQTDLAPSIVVASQVYHWEVVLRQIIAGMEDGDLGGDTYRIDLANGGVVIEYNPAFELDPTVRTRADDIVAGIIAETIDPGA